MASEFEYETLQITGVKFSVVGRWHGCRALWTALKAIVFGSGKTEMPFTIAPETVKGIVEHVEKEKQRHILTGEQSEIH